MKFTKTALLACLFLPLFGAVKPEKTVTIALTEADSTTAPYHIVATQAVVPLKYADGQVHAFTLTLVNKGQQALAGSTVFKLALIDKNNKVKMARLVEKVKPATWAPGQTITEEFMVKMGEYDDVTLAMGIFTNPDGKHPDVAFTNVQTNADGWLILKK